MHTNLFAFLGVAGLALVPLVAEAYTAKVNGHGETKVLGAKIGSTGSQQDVRDDAPVSDLLKAPRSVVTFEQSFRGQGEYCSGATELVKQYALVEIERSCVKEGGRSDGAFVTSVAADPATGCDVVSAAIDCAGVK